VRRIVWSRSALVDFEASITCIARDNPRATASVADCIDAAIRSLADTPTGRRGRVPGTYEKVAHDLPYFIAYALERSPASEPRLIVLRFVQGVRDWPTGIWPRPARDEP
jgi:plasmid stabilization system protein ParE